jgi:SAM-dependent methyltransferase
MNRIKETEWPKIIPEFTNIQQTVRDEWMKYWHEVLPNRYGVIEMFNQKYPLRYWNNYRKSDSACRGVPATLEIGAGLGEHIRYEDLTRQKYFAVELRENMAAVIREKFPTAGIYVGDIQAKTPFEDAQFDRILAIHVLEHLPNLPRALSEIQRLLKNNGVFSVVIPCEGGLAYNFARMISTKRIFDKRFKEYHVDYNWLMRTEHINLPGEIIEELEKFFVIDKKTFFPVPIPFTFCNLCIGIDLYKRH